LFGLISLSTNGAIDFIIFYLIKIFQLAPLLLFAAR